MEQKRIDRDTVSYTPRLGKNLLPNRYILDIDADIYTDVAATLTPMLTAFLKDMETTLELLYLNVQKYILDKRTILKCALSGEILRNSALSSALRVGKIVISFSELHGKEPERKGPERRSSADFDRERVVPRHVV